MNKSLLGPNPWWLRPPSTYARIALVIGILIGMHFVSIKPQTEGLGRHFMFENSFLAVFIVCLLSTVAVLLVVLAVVSFVLAVFGEFDEG